MDPLTDRQAAVLDFIRTEIELEGRPPTLDEIGVRFRLASSNGVRRHLTALEKKGYIERRRHSARGIRLVHSSGEGAGLPIVGRVAAGAPIAAIENLDGYLTIEGLFPGRGDLYCLEVRGDSMDNAGIHDGDYVVVRQKPVFENGEIGVAIVDEECTVKQLRRVGAQVELIPANPAYDRWTVDPATSDFRYGGEVIKVLSIREPMRG